MVPRDTDNTNGSTHRRPSCARHNLPLDGGPVLYWCPSNGHNVPAADISNDFQAVVA